MEKLLLTNRGEELLARVIAGETKVKFTKIQTSSFIYTPIQIRSLTSLFQVEQEVEVSSIEIRDNDNVVVNAMIDNSSVETSYSINSIGLFAQDDESTEILYGVSIAGGFPEYVPDKTSPVGLIINFTIDSVDSDDVTIVIDPTTSVNIEQFNIFKNTLITSNNGVHGLRFSGGKFQIYNNDTWSDAPVETLAEQNKIDALNIKMLGYTVPDEMEVQNYVDEETRTFHQRIGRVDISKIVQGRATSPNPTVFNYYCAGQAIGIKQNSSCFCSRKYENKSSGQEPGTIVIGTNVNIYDDSFSSVDKFKASNIGNYLYYELETERVFPIDGQEAGYLGKENTRTNLLNCKLGTITKNGVTCTNNGDGTYTLNGTSTDMGTGITAFHIESRTDEYALADHLLEPGKYKVVGCPKTNFTEGEVRINVDKAPTSLNWDTGDGVIFTIPNNSTPIVIKIRIDFNVTLNNLIFKPMLTTDLSATYDDFVPYTGDTGTLNGDVAQVRGAIGDAWNSTDTYSVGDLRIDENGLYRCLIQNSGQKPSVSPTYWEKTSFEEAVKNVTNSFNDTTKIRYSYQNYGTPVGDLDSLVNAIWDDVPIGSTIALLFIGSISGAFIYKLNEKNGTILVMRYSNTTPLSGYVRDNSNTFRKFNIPITFAN